MLENSVIDDANKGIISGLVWEFYERTRLSI
jgi:hypothetical protein